MGWGRVKWHLCFQVFLLATYHVAVMSGVRNVMLDTPQEWKIERLVDETFHLDVYVSSMMPGCISRGSHGAVPRGWACSDLLWDLEPRLKRPQLR